MPLHLSFGDIALRLGLTLLTGGLIGLNRSERGHSVGLRTTLLVTLAASLSMIQVNLLLGMSGKQSDSFIVMDLMRLPLGILSGMGFIGAGAILRRKDRTMGTTTAATLWFATVMGLCFGGGQLLLGMMAMVLGAFVLWCLKWLERRLPEERRGTLELVVPANEPSESEIGQWILTAGYRVSSTQLSYRGPEKRRRLRLDVRWRASLAAHHDRVPSFLESIGRRPEVFFMRWSSS